MITCCLVAVTKINSKLIVIYSNLSLPLYPYALISGVGFLGIKLTIQICKLRGNFGGWVSKFKLEIWNYQGSFRVVGGLGVRMSETSLDVPVSNYRPPLVKHCNYQYLVCK